VSHVKRLLLLLRDDPRYIPIPYLLMTLLMGVALWWIHARAEWHDRRDAAVSAWAQYDQRLSTCRSINDLRGQVRMRNNASRKIQLAFSDFLQTSVEFRNSIDRDTLAAKAAALKRTVDEAIAKQRPIVDVDCDSIIQPPRVPRPE
jgi:hypothetical protein